MSKQTAAIAHSATEQWHRQVMTSNNKLLALVGATVDVRCKISPTGCTCTLFNRQYGLWQFIIRKITRKNVCVFAGHPVNFDGSIHKAVTNMSNISHFFMVGWHVFFFVAVAQLQNEKFGCENPFFKFHS